MEAVLVGGPEGIADADRYRIVWDGQSTIEIPYLDGYEHFERARDPDPGPAAFEWTMRTRIAE